ncbi:MAG: 2Fe-2S iron-sulfur cluster-binding protein [Nitrospirae bacterium]|uniref:Ferredoxin n=1 Tax=Leptospirillum ferrodiazotrophum TaxID=412449 RepID=C6HVK4_9BACT|nr:MAG: ferredoxin [Leptospirillum ferrodiazotrophum]MCL5953347.1 2Fe-2S iron-sulfur cluster-binding protein [Nitrospirota bacterium]
MPKVSFIPDSRLAEPFTPTTVTVPENASILEAAKAAGVPLEHNCGGVCACSTCHVIVEDGFDRLSVMEEDEEDQLDRAEGLTLKSRLGCQARINGDISVRIPPCSRGSHEH